MTSSSSPTVREGFLCPICLKDFSDVSGLQRHFSSAHKGETNNSITLQEDLKFQVKGFFDKAKDRLIKPIESALTTQSELLKSSSSQITSATATAAEPSHNLSTLDDQQQYLEFEREVVSWQQDAKVPFCVWCQAKFTLTRRRHHCRLCGRILCRNCSRFISFPIARRLTNYDSQNDGEKGLFSWERETHIGDASQLKDKAEKLLTNTVSVLKNLKRRPSDSGGGGSEQSSLSSFTSQDVESQLRLCADCEQLLRRRDEQMEGRVQPPLVQQMYERLKELMVDAGSVYPSFCRMAESLGQGESLYDLQSANDLKLKLMKLQEQIDFVSKKINHFESETPNSRQAILQRNIRSYATAFIQEMIFYVPNIPTEEEYSELQRKYKTRMKEEIETERKRLEHLESPVRLLHNNKNTTPERSFSEVSRAQSEHHAVGWSPANVSIDTFHYNPFDEDEQTSIDPLQEQVILLKGYLKQAAESGRLDDARILEQNLKEIMAELEERRLSTPR